MALHLPHPPNGKVVLWAVLVSHLEKHQLAAVARAVIALADQEAQMALAHVGAVIVAQQVQPHLLLLVIVPFTLEMPEAVKLSMEVGVEVDRMLLEQMVMALAEEPEEPENR